MRSMGVGGFIFLFLLAFSAGCQKKAPETQASASAPAPARPAEAAGKADFFADSLLPAESRSAYASALLEAVGLMGDQNYEGALAALKKAQALDDQPLLRMEIERVQALRAEQLAAQTTTADIEAILRQGKADEAAKLTHEALKQFGAGTEAAPLAALDRQANAMLALQQPADARRAVLARQAQDARRQGHLRAALLDYEQALALGEDPALRGEYQQVRATLDRYDQARQRATELRRDPWQLEEAQAALQDAAAAWDTPRIRQDLAEVQLALTCRRDRLAVADFEVRGDVGLPLAGRTVADELLPAFQRRFDLLERGQLARLLAELKLDAGGWTSSDPQRAEFGRLARVRYLVLGSITPLNGLLVSARLVDTQSGLIVQTGRIFASSPEEMLRRLPELARQLQGDDRDRIAAVPNQAPPPPVPAGPAAFDPNNAAPPPVVILPWSERPAPLGTLSPQDFERLPALPLPGQPAPPPLLLDDRPPFAQRLLDVQLQLGDDLYRRGRFGEALARFRLCLELAPGRSDVRLRVNTCQPRVLPAPTLPQTAVPPGAFPAGDRLAVLNFAVFAPANLAPPELSFWLPERLAPYFSPPLELVDPAEVYWHMHQLGLSVQEVVQNPVARRWLGRTLGVRYFLVGMVHPANGLAVRTYLVDAEFGYRCGEGEIVVRSPRELNLRLRELAVETLLSPAERLRLQQQAALREAALLEAQQAFDGGQFAIAVDLFGQLRKKYPLNVQIGFFAQEAEARALSLNVQLGRQQAWTTRQTLAESRARELAQLTLAAEHARAAALVGGGDANRLQQQRAAAAHRLAAQARQAAPANPSLAVQLLQSALALQPSDELFRELAQVQAQQAAAAREHNRQARDRWLAEQLRRARAEQAELRDRLEEEQRRRQELEASRLAELRQRDQRAVQRLLDEAQKEMAAERFNTALAALSAARQLSRGPEVERLWSHALVGAAKAEAKKADAARLAELERQLAQEKAQREAAEQQARQAHEQFLTALKAAEEARQRQQFEVAVAKYTEAGRLQKSDAVLNGLKAAEEGLQQQRALADQKRRQEAEAKERNERIARLLSRGAAAEKGKNFAEALTAYREGLALAPDHVDLLAAQARAQAAQAESLATAEASERAKVDRQIERLAKLARQSLAARQFEASTAYVNQIKKLKDNDPAVALLEKEIAEARSTADQARADLQGKLADRARAQSQAQANREAELAQQQAALKERQRERLLANVQSAIQSRQFDVAAEGLREAARLAPTDPNVGRLQKQLADARTAARAEQIRREADAKARTEADEQLKTDKFRDHVRRGKKALADEDYKEAVAQLSAATDLFPGDTDAAMLLGLAESKLKGMGGAEEAERKKAEAEAKRKAEAEAKAKADAAIQAQEEARVKKREALRLVETGKRLVEERKYQEAANSFAAANKADPDNPEAARLLKVTRERLVEQEAMARERQAEADAQRKKMEAFAASMKAGQEAYARRDFADAVQHLKAALRQVPGDPQAQRALQLAERALAESRQPAPTPPPRPTASGPIGTRPVPSRSRPASSPPGSTAPTRPAAATPATDNDREVQELLKQARRFEEAGRLTDAIAAYRRAAQLRPADKRIFELLQRAEVTLFLELGKRDLKNKKFDDAAKNFNEVLKRVPNHPEATKGLEAAKKQK